MLGILDQSPVLAGATPREAVLETIALAREAERLGFARYWLAEHHAMRGLADPAPEILLARVAAETSRMRVGTGGVLLPHYSALKVAEQFRMLDALAPGASIWGSGARRAARSASRWRSSRVTCATSRAKCATCATTSTARCPRSTRSRSSPRCRPAKRRPRCGCWARRTTAPRSRRSSACRSPSRTSSAATRSR